MNWNRISLALFIGVMIGLAGCSDRPEIGEVTGTVTLDGEPLERALVSFYPDHGRCVGGYTDSEGKYELMYLHDVPGAKVGHHRVEITTQMIPEELSPGEDWDPSMSKEHVPPWYNVRSTLEANVEPDENVIDFALSIEEPEGWSEQR